jgi:hypothetical protein
MSKDNSPGLGGKKRETNGKEPALGGDRRQLVIIRYRDGSPDSVAIPTWNDPVTVLRRSLWGGYKLTDEQVRAIVDLSHEIDDTVARLNEAIASSPSMPPKAWDE